LKIENLKLKIAIGQLWQETNTFNPIPTTRDDFEHFGVSRGSEFVEKMANTNELGGFIQSLRAWQQQPEIVGLVRMPAWPGGMATRETFEWILDEVVASVKQALPIDGVLLALHGSMAADGVPDVEGEVLHALREIIGPSIPVVVTLDLHANITEQMVRQADAIVLYHTIPHVDVFETGVRGAEVMRRILIDGAKPVTAFQKIPIVVPPERANTQDLSSVSFGFRERLEELEADPSILAAGIATVQPWLDVPGMGTSVVVVTNGNIERAETECARIAMELWNSRRDYLPDLVSVEAGVRAAFENQEGLTVLSDSADATTSGAPGDSTHVLRELLRYNWNRPALIPMVAPEIVNEAANREIGSEWETRLGGVRDARHSQPITLQVTIDRLFDARFTISGHLSRNMAIDMGPSVVLRSGNIHILVTSRTGPHFAPEFFRSAGLDPFAAKVLIAKSPCGFRAAYAQVAKQIFVVQAPGCAPSDFWNYEYSQTPHPLWPWDEIEYWAPCPTIHA
jgi:microcystin degradation protein MlrC